MNFVPLYDRLLVRRCEAEQYQGKIEIPDSAKEKPMEGIVLSAGAGRVNDAGNMIAMSVKTGDRILMGKYAGTEIKIDGTELLILREDEVLGILTGVPETQESMFRAVEGHPLETTAPVVPDDFPEKVTPRGVQQADPKEAEKFLESLRDGSPV